MPTIELSVRNYQDSDHDQLLGLIIEFQNYLAAADTKKICRQFSSREEAEKYLDKSLNDVKTREGLALVAYAGSTMVGFLVGIIDRHKEDLLYTLGHIPGDDGWIGELYTKPEYRGQGIGKKLMQQAEKYFKEQGCMRSRLLVMADNHLARSVYDKMGYRERDLELSKDL